MFYIYYDGFKELAYDILCRRVGLEGMQLVIFMEMGRKWFCVLLSPMNVSQRVPELYQMKLSL